MGIRKNLRFLIICILLKISNSIRDHPTNNNSLMLSKVKIKIHLTSTILKDRFSNKVLINLGSITTSNKLVINHRVILHR